MIRQTLFCGESNQKLRLLKKRMLNMLSTEIPTASHIYVPGGCRTGSAEYRNSLEFCEEFNGLEEGVNRYDLLLLVKKIGQQAGFTPRMIQLLDYYLAYTRDCDWEEGSRPIVYQSISRTALDLGISERQIQKLEQGLFRLGAITWHDSGNYKRYGQRDSKTGRIIYAYGVELTPLAALKETLQQKLAEKQRHDKSWMETKRQISWYRSQIRATLQEYREEGAITSILPYEQRYEEIAIQIRSSFDLQRLQALLERHQELLSDLKAELGGGTTAVEQVTQAANLLEKPASCSANSEPQFVHNQTTTQESLNEFNTGLEHVTLGMVTQATSERFRDLLPTEPNWSKLVDAAYLLRRELGIPQESWADACHVLGRNGAALCVLITDQASLRRDNPVQKPTAYFRAMIQRAKRGELQLYRSIFGLLQRSGGQI